jgi:hypothetical protein
MSRIPFAAILLIVSGCQPFKSRYAMDDREYAAKYAEGAESGDLLGKAKQAIDARHVAGLSGWYASGAGQYTGNADRPVVGAEVGYEHYQTSYFSQRMGGMLLFDGELPYAGIDIGARLQTPTRFAPFLGAGIFNGIIPSYENAENDNADNNKNGFIDEAGESDWTIKRYTVAIYPELGAHFWINGSGRATLYSRYFVTSAGRDQDQWIIGGQMALFSR